MQGAYPQRKHCANRSRASRRFTKDLSKPSARPSTPPTANYRPQFAGPLTGSVTCRHLSVHGSVVVSGFEDLDLRRIDSVNEPMFIVNPARPVP